MNGLEERVSSVLDAAAESVTAAPLSPQRPQHLARRRRRRRHLGALATVAIAVVGVGAGLRALPAGQSSVATAHDQDLDADGLPVDTGPQLAWEQVDVGDLELTDIIWSGQRFVAVGGPDRDRLLVSTDGRSWEPTGIELPAGAVFVGLEAGGGRLVAWSQSSQPGEATAGGPATGDTSIHVSDDHGTTWRDLGPLDLAPPRNDPDDYVTDGEFVNAVAVDADTVVAVSSRHVWPDVREVLLDRGLVAADDVVRVATLEVRADSAETTATYCVTDDPAADCDDPTTIEFVAHGLEGYDFGAQPSTVWIADDDGPFELAAELDGEVFRVVSADGGFVSLGWSGRHTVRRSDGGRAWTDVELAVPVHHLSGFQGQVVAVGGTGVGTEYYRSVDGGVTWTARSLPAHLGDIAGGPAGQVVTGSLVDDRSGPVRALLDWVTGRRGDDGTRLVGWSADGGSWGWQRWEDAFGDGGWATVAVGADRAVALVWGSGGSPLDVDAPQLFVAEIGS
ncbi:MAG: hypothetical protein AAFN30_09890 [Actinomycetota bacterium]